MTIIENFELKNKVKHPQFGEGEVIEVQGSGDHQKVRVDFKETVGVKRLAVRLARLKKISERPTLPQGGEGEEVAEEVEVAAAPVATAPPARSRGKVVVPIVDEEEDEDVEPDEDVEDEDEEEV
jgi:hypothetical protein